MQQGATEPRAGKVAIPLKEAVDRALAALNAGRLDVAERLAAAVVAAEPSNGAALQVQAILRHRQGNLAEAIRLQRHAVTATPGNGVMLSNLCEMLRLNGDVAAAVEIGRRAVAVAPQLATAHANLGIALFDAGDLDAARAAQEAALAIAPDLAISVNNLGSILRKRGETAAAEAQYRRALELNPDHPDALRNLGALLLESERPREALQILARDLRGRPNDPEVHRAFGRAFLQLDDLDRAELALRKAVSIKPDMAEALLGLAEVFQKKNHPALALEQTRKAVEAAPDLAYAHQQMAQCEADLGNVANAFAALETALRLDPNFCPALLSRGYLHMENGDMELARHDFDRVSELKPGSVDALFCSVRADKIKPGDPRIAELQKLAAESDKMIKGKAIAVQYTLAKSLEDIKDHDAAFRHYAEGGRLKRSTVAYDPDAQERKVDALIETFDARMVQDLRAAADPSARPIFVLGMPRSGTTLTESIIASHPQVFGAGELHHMQRRFPIDTEAHVRDLARVLKGPASAITERIRGYLADLHRHSPGMPHITDKMPANFQFVGLIHALLPNARIIHVQRDPVDTCLSCFTRLFERSQYHSYDQVELGRFYNGYARLMAHWRATLPADAFYTIRYESLVADPEPEARALIAACGLDWDDACLRFHETKRRVRTASVQQVREPMYATSVAKWRVYEKHLGPLLRTLAEGGNLPDGVSV